LSAIRARPAAATSWCPPCNRRRPCADGSRSRSGPCSSPPAPWTRRMSRSRRASPGTARAVTASRLPTTMMALRPLRPIRATRRTQRSPSRPRASTRASTCRSSGPSFARVNARPRCASTASSRARPARSPRRWPRARPTCSRSATTRWRTGPRTSCPRCRCPRLVESRPTRRRSTRGRRMTMSPSIRSSRRLRGTAAARPAERLRRAGLRDAERCLPGHRPAPARPLLVAGRRRPRRSHRSIPRAAAGRRPGQLLRRRRRNPARRLPQLRRPAARSMVDRRRRHPRLPDAHGRRPARRGRSVGLRPRVGWHRTRPLPELRRSHPRARDPHGRPLSGRRRLGGDEKRAIDRLAGGWRGWSMALGGRCGEELLRRD
jgi:hypothetical protein